MRQNIAKLSIKSKKPILAADNSGVSLSSDCTFCLSNKIDRSFIGKLRNNGLKMSPFLSPIEC